MKEEDKKYFQQVLTEFKEIMNNLLEHIEITEDFDKLDKLIEVVSKLLIRDVEK